MSKKTFKRGFVYKLTIGDYFYIGITNTLLSTRYNQHRDSCFKRCKGCYHMKKYKYIRDYIRKKEGRTPNKNDFKKYVKQKLVATLYTSREDLKKLESELICLDNPFCLNSVH